MKEQEIVLSLQYHVVHPSDDNLGALLHLQLSPKHWGKRKTGASQRKKDKNVTGKGKKSGNRGNRRVRKRNLIF